jgi:hypothetical protein
MKVNSCQSTTMQCCPDCLLKDAKIRRLQTQVQELMRIMGNGTGIAQASKENPTLNHVKHSNQRVLKDSFSQMKSRLERQRARRKCLVAWRTATKTSKVFRGLIINARAEQASRRRNQELYASIFATLRNAQSNRRETALSTLQHSLM